MARSKLMTLEAAARLVPDGASITVGGTLLHRTPAALVRELVRQGRRDLELVKPSPAYDLDLLCAAGCLSRSNAGIVTFEANFGMAKSFRRAVESGQIHHTENSWPVIYAGMRAASNGIPFEPIAGLAGSDIPAAAGFRTVKDPYTGAELYAIPAIRPDWAIIHVQEADDLGNARIYGSPYWDLVMSRAAARVILTAERILPTEELARLPELTRIPSFLVEAVVHAPEGARPTSCHPYYGIDEAGVRAYLEAADRPEALQAYLDAADRALRWRPASGG